LENKEQLRRDIQTGKLPRGHYTTGDISTYLYPGNVVVIERTPNVEEFYIGIGNRGVQQLLNVDTQQYLPLDTILQGEITVRNASISEKQNVFSRHPEIKLRDNMMHQLEQDPSIKGLQIHEIMVEGNQARAQGEIANNAPEALFARVSKKVIKRAHTNQASKILVEHTKDARYLGVVNRSALDDLKEQYLETGMKESSSYGDFRRIRERLTSSAKKVHDVLSSIAQDTSRSNLLKLANTIQNKKGKEYIHEFKSSRNNFNKVVFTDNVPDAFARETMQAYQELDVATAREKGLVNYTSPEGQKMVRVVSDHSKAQFLQDTLQGLQKQLTGHNVHMRTFNTYGQMLTHAAIVEDGAYKTLLKRDYPMALAGLDLQFGTSASRTSSMQLPVTHTLHGASDVLAVTGAASLPGVGDSRIVNSLSRMSEAVSSSVNEQDAIRAGFGVSDELVTRVAGVAAKKAVITANRTRAYVEGGAIEREIAELSPAFNTDAMHNRLPHSTTQTTGIFQSVVGLMGVYFYQQMMHNWTRKAVEVYKYFHQPGQIIEAKKHSSTETSIRRMLTTDFGGSWSFIKAAEALVVGASREQFSFAAFRGLVQKYGMDEAGKLDPRKAWGVAKDVLHSRLTNLVSRHISTNGQPLTKQLVSHIHEAAKSVMSYVGSHRKAILTSTSGVLLLSRIGKSSQEEQNKKFLDTRKKNANQGELLQYNTAMPPGTYSSMTALDGRISAGFASPLDFEILRYTGPKLANLMHLVTGVTASESVENILLKKGFHYPVPHGRAQANVAAGALSEAFGLRSRVVSGMSVSSIGQAAPLARAEFATDLHREALKLESVATATGSARQVAHTTLTHGKLQILNRELEATGLRTTSNQGLLRDIPLANMNKEAYYRRSENAVTAEPAQAASWAKRAGRARSLGRKLGQAGARSIGRDRSLLNVDARGGQITSEIQMSRRAPLQPVDPVITTNRSSRNIPIDWSRSFQGEALRKDIPETNLNARRQSGASKTVALRRAEDAITTTGHDGARGLIEPRVFQSSYRQPTVDLSGYKDRKSLETNLLRAGTAMNKAGFSTSRVSRYANSNMDYSGILKNKMREEFR